MNSFISCLFFLMFYLINKLFIYSLELEMDVGFTAKPKFSFEYLCLCCMIILNFY